MEDKPILFSVIIPTYNRVELLLFAIQSVLDQADSNIEIIVIDDGSTDQTKKRLDSLSLVGLKYFFQENQGQSAARNLGVEKARGEYVVFMDDDDYWEENHLNVFREATEKDPSRLTIFRTGFKRVYEDGREKKVPNYRAGEDGHPVKWAAYNMCGLWSLCIPRKHLVENHSPVGFPHWQDTHLILRLLAKFPFHQISSYTYVYRIHSAMGSVRNEKRDEILERAEVNVAAMDDLFVNYQSLMQSFLPSNTLKYLKAEKFLEYAILERSNNLIGKSTLLSLSFENGIYLRLWKHYLMYLYAFFRIKTT